LISTIDLRTNTTKSMTVKHQLEKNNTRTMKTQILHFNRLGINLDLIEKIA